MENRNYSKVYRVMHWLIALSMLFLLLTVFLRLGWMNKVHIADIIKQYLATTNLNQGGHPGRLRAPVAASPGGGR